MARRKESDDFTSITEIDDEIIKTLNVPNRLMIMAYLYIAKEADFVFLRGQTGLTDGNLSSHMSYLEKKEYVSVKKKFKGKKPQTIYSLTEKGRDAFQKYREHMKRVVDILPD